MLGYISIKIYGFEIQKHIKKIQSTYKVKQLYTENDAIYVTISILEKSKILNYCEKNDLIYEIIVEKGLITALVYVKRYGLYAGAIFFIILTFLLSNVAFDIRIVGNIAPQDESKILEILEIQGIKPGAYIPTMNFIKAENELLKQSDLVSWASIGSSGSVITVNVSTFTHKSEGVNTRIPCNIIASHDGQITKTNVLVGELCIVLGQAVKKGDILISGIAESRNGNTYYKHSMGEIVAEFTERVNFYQPYQDVEIEYSRTTYNKFLTFFEFEIPLFTQKPNFFEYEDKEVVRHFMLLGITLPIGIKTEEYREIIKTKEELSTEETKSRLLDKINTYEQNLLSQYDVIDKTIDYHITEYGIGAEVTYLLSGNIGMESPIYYDDKNTDNY